MTCANRKYGPEKLGDVLVLGLGKSGKSVARYLVSLLGTRVESMFIAAGARNGDSESFVESLAVSGASYAFGDEALAGLDRHFDLCIASPGIPFWHQLYVDGARLSEELISEVEFSWRESALESTWIAITGTNGKTTTTALAAHVLRECGFAAEAVGNIGDVCLDAVAAGRTSVYVAEVSSYQLESTRLFAPDIAVMLNITPDHLHWHRSFEAYRDAKFKLLRGVAGKCASGVPLRGGLSTTAPRVSARDDEAGGASRFEREGDGGMLRQTGGLAILDATNDVVRAKVRELKEAHASYVPLGTADGIAGDMRARCGAANAAFIGDDGMLTVAYRGCEHAVVPVRDLLIHGEHNASNALAAAAVAVCMGAPDDSIAAALASFEPLEHRIEPCGSVGGVACYNDSKATNVDAACKALSAFPGKRVVVLLGGDDKGTDLAALVACVHASAGVAVCFGDAGQRFVEAFQAAGVSAPAGFVLARANHMADAFDVALQHAASGDVILLSPACASFDEFTSFEQRGDVFKQLVAERAQACGRRA